MSHPRQDLKQGKTLYSFFKPREESLSKSNTHVPNIDTSILDEQPPSKCKRVELAEFDDTSLERDPGLRLQIWQHPINQHNEIRRAYLKVGAFQPNLLKYPRSKCRNQYRRF